MEAACPESELSAPAAMPQYDLSGDKMPFSLAFAQNDFNGFFLKGCKWSPDGTTLLVCADDHRMRLYPLPEQFYSGDFSQPIPEMQCSLTYKEGGTIYDYCWLPWLGGESDGGHCFLTTSQNCPIHMWDCRDGSLRATYKSINHMDELEVAVSVGVSPDGTCIYAGSRKYIRVFDVNRPGRQVDGFKTHERRQAGQAGIISCFAFLPENQVFAAGSYSRSVAIYDERSYEQTMIFEGHAGGVTQVKFISDGNTLLTGARKDNELLAWDMRNPGAILAVIQRSVDTNQRIYFDIDPSSRFLCTGSCNGLVKLVDLDLINSGDDSSDGEQTLSPILEYQAHEDCVNSCSFHPTLAMVATSSGQRCWPADPPDSDDDESSSSSLTNIPIENNLKLWWLGA